MKVKRIVLFILGVFLIVGLSVQVSATPVGYYVQGVSTTLSNDPDYDWYYGCSPTAAGMMMGYYDINGYSGLSYGNLVPGGEAETTTYGPGTYLANDVIASPGHIADFYPGGYLAFGDDVPPPRHSFDSLADFMGTSQDSVGNKNGWTKFYYWEDGSRLYATNALAGGFSDIDGMYGMWEYFNYAGYGSGTGNNTDFYTQPTDNQGFTYGFTFADYMAEIDAGRPVMIHVEGHSMFGYGYDDSSGLVYLHDTWTAGQHSMTWGGSYPYGNEYLEMWGVTCFTPTGGVAIPEPATLFLVGSGLFGLGAIMRKFRAYTDKIINPQA